MRFPSFPRFPRHKFVLLIALPVVSQRLASRVLFHCRCYRQISTAVRTEAGGAPPKPGTRARDCIRVRVQLSEKATGSGDEGKPEGALGGQRRAPAGEFWAARGGTAGCATWNNAEAPFAGQSFTLSGLRVNLSLGGSTVCGRRKRLSVKPWLTLAACSEKRIAASSCLRSPTIRNG